MAGNRKDECSSKKSKECNQLQECSEDKRTSTADDKMEVICLKCKKKGHYTNECLHDHKDTEENFAIYEVAYDDNLDKKNQNYLFTNIGFDTVPVDVSNTDHV